MHEKEIMQQLKNNESVVFLYSNMNSHFEHIYSFLYFEHIPIYILNIFIFFLQAHENDENNHHSPTNLMLQIHKTMSNSIEIWNHDFNTR